MNPPLHLFMMDTMLAICVIDIAMAVHACECLRVVNCRSLTAAFKCIENPTNMEIMSRCLEATFQEVMAKC